MRNLRPLLPVLILATAHMAGTAEETKKAAPKKTTQSFLAQEPSEKRKAAKKPAAAKPEATESGADQRIKQLESENLKLRKELAEKGGAAAAPPGAEAQSAEGALAELKAGNQRFVAGARTRSQLGVNDPALRQALAKGQAPFAVIVTCSDSRLGENFIFDQELGRLFTIREAGNSPDIQGLASIEYAVEHLGSKLVVVMGHDACGAVKVVMESGPAILPGNLWSLQAAMSGLLESVHPEAGEAPAGRLMKLVKSNAERQARVVVGRSSIVQHLVAAGKVTVVPALYDLASGKVQFLAAVRSETGKAPAEHH